MTRRGLAALGVLVGALIALGMWLSAQDVF
ncbi:hypothetical protein N803_06090 [Knoellia subterranea KCTC 19937]|uniref:Uncharacterized protein n=1 Tax=Knoellia subterranea KCTC 19937 TaxID=1385521 RepID=A0A0A0JJD9_9MICO|nr:hypothetical protein N803_06090 [Knoellia subterranea KCTC 19937]